MANLFATILNMSLTASIIIGIVLLARLCLKKAPKIFSYVLWSVVLFRLLCPVSISLPVSVLTPMSDASTSAGTSYTASMEYISLPERADSLNTQAQQDVPVENVENNSTNESAAITAPEVDTSAIVVEQQKLSAGEIVLTVFGWLWAAGMVGVLGMTTWQTISLKRRLADACIIRGNIFESDKIDTAFILGVFNPKIYLPLGLPFDIQKAVVAHEQTHQRRGDHIVKLVSYIALAIHWFNPLVWLSFKLMCDDMEKSCDEAVIRTMNKRGYTEKSVKKAYSNMLFSFGYGKQNIFSPVSFAEHSTKERIINIANYSQLTKPIVAVIAAVILVIALISIVNPIRASSENDNLVYATIQNQHDLDAVTSMDSIEKLNMTIDCHDQTLDFSGISSMESLHSLSINFTDTESDNPNIPAFFSQIGNIPNLTELNCGSQNGWKAHGISEYLSRLTQLDSLSLVLHSSETSVDFLKGIKQLTSLSIVGYADQMDLSALSSLPDLKYLSIYLSSFDKETIESIEALEYLNICVNDSNCLNGFSFEKLSSLREFSILDAGAIDIESISHLTNLRTLLLNFNADTSSTPVNIELFSELTDIEYIEFSNISLYNIDALKHNDNLKEIRLTNVEVSADEIEILTSSKPEIQVIITPENAAVNSDAKDKLTLSIGNITFDSNVTELDLSNQIIDDAAIDCLEKCSQLRILKLYESGVADLSRIINLPALEELDLRYAGHPNYDGNSEQPCFVDFFSFEEICELENLDKLTELGVTIPYRYNESTDTTYISKDDVQYLNDVIGSNNISSVKLAVYRDMGEYPSDKRVLIESADYSALVDMQHLTSLVFGYDMSDMNVLLELDELTELSLGQGYTSPYAYRGIYYDYTPVLMKMNNLTALTIWSADAFSLYDYSCLGNLQNLRQLVMGDCCLDYSFLNNLNNLDYLCVSMSETDREELASINIQGLASTALNLRYLYLSNVYLHDFSSIKQLQQLEVLYLMSTESDTVENGIFDISALYELPSLLNLFICGYDEIPDEQVKVLEKQVPNCEIIVQQIYY